MWTRVFICLLGAVFMYEVITSDIYISELMVESNVTLEAQDILSSWNTSFNLQVAGTAQSHTVTLLDRELVAECLIVGEDYSCNCSTGYHWSNEVCYTYNCCRETTCTKNVSFILPICVEKDEVVINGSVEVTSWTQTHTNELKQGFELLNALKDLNITTRTSTSGNTIADFGARVSVKLNTSKLQEIMDGLKSSLGTNLIFVDTQGMVTINASSGTVGYMSKHDLRCTFEEATDRAGWNLSRKFERFELNNGKLVTLDFNCHTEKYKSCVAVTLVNVTGIWSGTYECGFTIGSVRHTARTSMHVAPLPDSISISINPLTADCTVNDPPTILVTAIIPIPERYNYSWTYHEKNKFEESTENSFNYRATIDCNQKDKPHHVSITFKNNKDQEKTASVEIPVLYAGEAFCKEDTSNGESWPKAPVESTVINRSCPDGRVGYKSRTCSKNGMWMDVYPNCVSEELQKVSQAADNFLNGLGATDKVAKNIFGGIKNGSKSNSDFDVDIADTIASINVVDTMAMASKNIALQEEVFPEFVEAASNMLNSNWTGVNNTVRYKMSSKYLNSVEDLVKNINVNTSSGFNSTNGLFILLTGCFAEQKVREELFKIIKAKSGRNNNSIKKLTSSATATTYTKDK
ncbi:uncharacterized protein adgrf3b isoform 2-T2 [Odontesthes bonariensis]|uniref:uncharacterized protein adgrf3b isoform X2 n=1 Tax=Odontesthes bonariensis TaxID=219752 RepID=UPI003F583222